MTFTYPVKVVSRSLPSTRTNKIRVSWFVVGTAFGIGCTSALTPLASGHWLHASQNTAPVAIVAEADQDTPPLESIVAAEPPPPPVFEKDHADAADAAVPAVAEAPVAQVQEPQAAPVVLTTPDGKQAAAEPETPAPQPQQVAKADENYPKSVSLTVKNGDTLLNMLTDAGAPHDEAFNAVEAMKKTYNPKKLDIGQNIDVELNKNAGGNTVIASLNMPISNTSSLEMKRTESDNFDVRKIDAPVERKLARANTEIQGSLYQTGVNNNIPPALLSDIINAYSYDVDFQRDIKQGDSMDVLYERMETKEGAVASYGNVIFAELDLGGRTLKVYRFTDASGHADFYNERGESIRKALLRTPINGAKITSGYGFRTHPILGYSKMHRGVDFGAPLGTPIYAAGDGTVDFVGKRGGYGNYLRIKHNGTYSSAYAHISRYAASIHPGMKVKQGQIIAYVGATGMATGPHLHYEILVNNEQVNPSNVKFKTGNVLQGRELASFRQNISSIEARLNATPRNGDLASAETSPKHVN